MHLGASAGYAQTTLAGVGLASLQSVPALPYHVFLIRSFLLWPHIHRNIGIYASGHKKHIFLIIYGLAIIHIYYATKLYTKFDSQGHRQRRQIRIWVVPNSNMDWIVSCCYYSQTDFSFLFLELLPNLDLKIYDIIYTYCMNFVIFLKIF